MKFGIVLLLTVVACAISVPASAETIIYRYDAKGRLVLVEKTNTKYIHVAVQIQRDKANNRTQVVSTVTPR